jgi:hypothetical protein
VQGRDVQRLRRHIGIASLITVLLHTAPLSNDLTCLTGTSFTYSHQPWGGPVLSAIRVLVPSMGYHVIS